MEVSCLNAGITGLIIAARVPPLVFWLVKGSDDETRRVGISVNAPR